MSKSKIKFNTMFDQIPLSVKQVLWIGNGEYKNINFKSLQTSDKQYGITISVDGNHEPSALYTNLPISNQSPEPFNGLFDLFNGYSEFTPAQRMQYLEWLINMRDGLEFQYPLVFYQGLERHVINGNLDLAFSWMNYIIYVLDYTEISGYFFVATLYAYLKFGTSKYMDMYFSGKSLSWKNKMLFKLITGKGFTSSDISRYLWYPDIKSQFSFLRKYPTLCNYYLPKAIKLLYGESKFYLPDSIHLDYAFGNLFNSRKRYDNQFLLANISFDLESERTIWINSLIKNTNFLKTISEIFAETTREVKCELKRRASLELKKRDAKLKNMYSPL